LLEEQDRGLWDHALVQRGFLELNRSAAGDRLTEFHLQAGIASASRGGVHDSKKTDWEAILTYYNELAHLNHSPVVALNRARRSLHDKPDLGDALKEIEKFATSHDARLFFTARHHRRFPQTLWASLPRPLSITNRRWPLLGRSQRKNLSSNGYENFGEEKVQWIERKSKN